MNPTLLKLYHHLPAGLQSFVASRHGARLMRLRYGEVYRRELPRFAERETWSPAQWANWQTARLQALLLRAVTLVPYYRREHAAGRFPINEVRTADDLSRLPILEKETVRAAPRDFLADDCTPENMYEEATSGTTGTPLRLWWSPETHQSWYACFERRIRHWNDVRLGDPWAMLGGQLIVPQARTRPPFWVWNAPARQLYMSSYHLRGDFLDAYLDELLRRQIVYLFGYASSLDALAVHALERGRSDVRLRVAISNAEPLYAHQREHIERAFGCPARDMYAPAELTVAAFECRERRMHLSPDVGITEAVDEHDRLVEPGQAGDLVVTSLLNPDHVLIRYRQGDRGVLGPRDERCPCGRTLPLLASIEGRSDDVLLSPDGRKVGRLDPVFKAALRVREAQIVQERLTRLVVRVVPAPGYAEADAAAIRAAICQRMGEVEVDIEIVDRLERTSAGKLRAVISKLSSNPALV
ncbi:MAG: hypothetical protein K1X74_13995 [Pirellulales bacterium]|nr:hypothetical protein [Pirellulales bacterium]